MKARIIVTLKSSVLDPQGKAIASALNSLNFENVQSVRQGKVFDIILDDMSSEIAKQKLEEMCEQLLTNTVVEDYAIEFL
ncbi:phosphoribosylformylglycinamidine synthase, purS protein [Bartonella bacilliformis str. Heidi Mejia]|uniref:Phosphoribosylformylglycinamidine synthase subunit PurS n=2 Tax=Bartonella bacilliformis TaxID=774 RepID=A1UT44_BARBK|nr:phosphoribosylformylglycinamidine synthase subunit PurS [Bartonella bacilliformis]ABM44630.1 phosphoribosylformylglycinamidine synthase, PurS protein [Bartonella bacilliformis KC583]AMG85935.1 phosphoribosylformylglycinamidine synthase subunit PurS [Bartonella bacilliformis]EKS43833.1 phosphoribosylformylglycinamidine synthase subunit PurS [Bartonella bacilliformis INS]EYS89848.1 phosphoribosylformylglycinamidine synthase, purS protein [Bartonella bacilliformis San Pedro600-02]EYS91911.1 ph